MLENNTLSDQQILPSLCELESMEETKCDWLDQTGTGYHCRLRGQNPPIPEVTQKCLQPDLAVICVDAYTSLARGRESMAEGSTDAFPWLMDAASQFENLSELDNALNSISMGVEFALKHNLVDRAYSFFTYGRTIYETGISDEEPSLRNPDIKKHLVALGERIVEAAEKPIEVSPLSAVQAELKASILGGISLKKAQVESDTKDLSFSHGKMLYEKKGREYREGAEKFLSSGMTKQGVIFACMASLSDLMLGKPKDGMEYLARTAENPDVKDDFQGHPCFKWTRLVFKALVKRDKDLIVTAQKLFLSIPWSYKDDEEFARRVMDSVERRITA